MPELDSVRDDLLLCLQFHEFVASVVVQCRANIEALLCSVVPGLAHCGFGVDKHSAAHGDNRSLIEVEQTIEVFPGGYLWVNCGLAQ